MKQSMLITEIQFMNQSNQMHFFMLLNIFIDIIKFLTFASAMG